MQATYDKIIQRLAKIYDGYEEKANQLGDDKRQKSGAPIDKQEKVVMDRIENICANLEVLIRDMEKSESMKAQDMRKYVQVTRDCWKSLQQIRKKKSLLFKTNEYILKLAEDTEKEVNLMRERLGKVGETVLCGCFGSEY